MTGKTPHNIRDYIQRDRIKKFDTEGNIIEYAKNGQLRVSMKEVRAFLYLVLQRDEKHHHAGLHPELGFYDVPEHQRTKHVHRLHPYLGKFISTRSDWTPLRDYENAFSGFNKPDFDVKDPWQFKNFLVKDGD